MERIPVLALTLFLISTTLLALLAHCPDVRAGEISNMEGRCVRVCGVVVTRMVKERYCVVDLFDGNVVRVVFFHPMACPTGQICVEGRVERWRGKYELVALSVG